MIERAPSLSALMVQHLQGQEAKRFSVETDGYLHVSDLFDGCMRQIHFSRTQSVMVIQLTTASEKMCYEMGNAIEATLRAWFIEAGILLDDGRPHLVNEEWKIVGHPDGRLRSNLLLEIKAMDPALFKLTKNRLLGYQQFQAELYAWMDSAAQILVFCATWGQGKMPFRDHRVRFNLHTVEAVKRTLSPLMNAQAGGPLPGRVCTTADSPRAILCPFRQTCFQQPSNSQVKTLAEELKIGLFLTSAA